VKEKTLVIDQMVSKVAVLFHGGTSGSNPASSSGESDANLSRRRRRDRSPMYGTVGCGSYWNSRPGLFIEEPR